jgi:D-aminoacyl-tRNA deacylase
MRVVIQRVSHARVLVDGVSVGAIGAGMLLFVCVMRGDTLHEARNLAAKCAHLRFFADEQGRMNLSALQARRAALVVSQFTLAADGRQGRRPSFDHAAPPELAAELYAAFVAELTRLGLEVATGRFAAHMQVELVNDGPVTFSLDLQPVVPAAAQPPPP